MKTVWVKSTNLEKRLELTKRGTGGLHSVIRSTLLCSRLAGLLPLNGFRNPLSNELSFNLCSPYTIIYAISFSGQVMMFVTNVIWFLMAGVSMSNVSNILFYSSGFISTLILAIIARSWPKLVMEVEQIERNLPPFTRNVAMYCNITTFVVLISAIVEHMLSQLYGFSVAYYCSKNDIARTYFARSMPWIFDFTPYSLWKGILGEVFNIQSTFMWSYNDVLIMVISIYLTEHFIIHSQLLKKSLNLDFFSCMEFRTQYLKIVRLVKLINGQIGIYILTSFGSNLYWICLQLFNSLKSSQTNRVLECREKDHEPTINEIVHKIYFTYSFSFLVMRTVLVLILAARVHSTSLLPLPMLYEVSADKFDIEVQRYIDQVHNLKVALSGLDFFHVTRTMILTLLGTIVTYELVLLQFNK